MTTAEDYENRTVGWWLKQLSLRQIWGLVGIFAILIGLAISIGVWVGRQSLVVGNGAYEIETQEPDTVKSLPDGLTSFDVRVLRILAEPHQGSVPTEYLAYRLKASTRRVKGSIEKLELLLQPGPTILDRQIVYVVRTEGGDVLSAILSQRGVRFMDENKLFE